MTLQSAPYYWLTCDGPGCGAKSTDEGDYTAWDDEDRAAEDAENSDWWVSDSEADDQKHYCSEHVPKCAKCGDPLDTDGQCYCDADDAAVRA